MDKYEELAIKIANNLEFKDLFESYVYFKTEELKQDYDLFKKMSEFFQEEE